MAPSICFTYSVRRLLSGFSPCYLFVSSALLESAVPNFSGRPSGPLL